MGQTQTFTIASVCKDMVSQGRFGSTEAACAETRPEPLRIRAELGHRLHANIPGPSSLTFRPNLTNALAAEWTQSPHSHIP